ncbi:Cytochrome c553 [Microbulbifer donghaiensis]|uniref:Cytochrome c553 n=1 Tax=Microbulbifer donghaiensis TaxID=494016 RepID=A0A1M4YUB5_9GAMM|nr:c-type cytochrome [Microbulbifer donghaiensis]SHF09343.1 Cytochrome c553 [Microbulbifer donghaiensis]
MHLKTIIAKSLLLAPLFIAASVSHAADAEAGKGLYGTCAACHGQAAEGSTAMKAPALAGQSADYLVRQLQYFRSGVRGTAEGDALGAQMRPMAQMLADDAAVENVSAFIAGLPAASPAATVAGDPVQGNKQYQSKCGACHGSAGQGNDALNSPRLVGLGDAYLIRQFENFRKGLRGSHPDDKYGRQMKMMAATLNDQQLKDVAAFLNSKTE